MNSLGDIDSLRTRHECDRDWKIRREFLETHQNIGLSKERLVALSNCLVGVILHGCKYHEAVMLQLQELQGSLFDCRGHQIHVGSASQEASAQCQKQPATAMAFIKSGNNLQSVFDEDEEDEFYFSKLDFDQKSLVQAKTSLEYELPDDELPDMFPNTEQVQANRPESNGVGKRVLSTLPIVGSCYGDVSVSEVSKNTEGYISVLKKLQLFSEQYKVLYPKSAKACSEIIVPACNKKLRSINPAYSLSFSLSSTTKTNAKQSRFLLADDIVVAKASCKKKSPDKRRLYDQFLSNIGTPGFTILWSSVHEKYELKPCSNGLPSNVELSSNKKWIPSLQHPLESSTLKVCNTQACATSTVSSCIMDPGSKYNQEMIITMLSRAESSLVECGLLCLLTHVDGYLEDREIAKRRVIDGDTSQKSELHCTAESTTMLSYSTCRNTERNENECRFGFMTESAKESENFANLCDSESFASTQEDIHKGEDERYSIISSDNQQPVSFDENPDIGRKESYSVRCDCNDITSTSQENVCAKFEYISSPEWICYLLFNAAVEQSESIHSNVVATLPSQLFRTSTKLKWLASCYCIKMKCNPGIGARNYFEEIGKENSDLKVTETLKQAVDDSFECILHVDDYEVGRASAVEKHLAIDAAFEELVRNLMQIHHEFSSCQCEKSSLFNIAKVCCQWSCDLFGFDAGNTNDSNNSVRMNKKIFHVGSLNSELPCRGYFKTGLLSVARRGTSSEVRSRNLRPWSSTSAGVFAELDFDLKPKQRRHDLGRSKPKVKKGSHKHMGYNMLLNFVNQNGTESDSVEIEDIDAIEATSPHTVASENSFTAADGSEKYIVNERACQGVYQPRSIKWNKDSNVTGLDSIPDKIHAKLEGLARSYSAKRQFDPASKPEKLIHKVLKEEMGVNFCKTAIRQDDGSYECKLYVDQWEIGRGSGSNSLKAVDSAYCELIQMLMTLNHKSCAAFVDASVNNCTPDSNVRMIESNISNGELTRADQSNMKGFIFPKHIQAKLEELSRRYWAERRLDNSSNKKKAIRKVSNGDPRITISKTQRRHENGEYECILYIDRCEISRGTGKKKVKADGLAHHALAEVFKRLELERQKSAEFNDSINSPTPEPNITMMKSDISSDKSAVTGDLYQYNFNEISVKLKRLARSYLVKKRALTNATPWCIFNAITSEDRSLSIVSNIKLMEDERYECVLTLDDHEVGRSIKPEYGLAKRSSYKDFVERLLLWANTLNSTSVVGSKTAKRAGIVGPTCQPNGSSEASSLVCSNGTAHDRSANATPLQTNVSSTNSTVTTMVLPFDADIKMRLTMIAKRYILEKQRNPSHSSEKLIKSVMRDNMTKSHDIQIKFSEHNGEHQFIISMDGTEISRGSGERRCVAGNVAYDRFGEILLLCCNMESHLDGCMTSTTTGLKIKLCDVSLAQSLTTEVNGENVMATMYIPVATLKKKFKILATHFAAEKDRKFPLDAKKLVKDIIEDERFGVLLRIYIGDDGNFECILYIGQHKIGRGCGRKQRHALNAACKALGERLADPELHVENDGDTDRSSVARREGVTELYKLSEDSSGLSTCEQRSIELILSDKLLEVPLNSASNLPSMNSLSGSIEPAPISHQAQADLSVLAGKYLVEKRANPCCKAKTLMNKVFKTCPLIKVFKLTKRLEDGVYESTIEVGGVIYGYGSASRHDSAVDAAHDRFIEVLMQYAKNGGSNDKMSDNAVCVTSNVGAVNLCKQDSRKSSINSDPIVTIVPIPTKHARIVGPTCQPNGSSEANSLVCSSGTAHDRSANATPLQTNISSTNSTVTTMLLPFDGDIKMRLTMIAKRYILEKQRNPSHSSEKLIKSVMRDNMTKSHDIQTKFSEHNGEHQFIISMDGTEISRGSGERRCVAENVAYDRFGEILLLCCNMESHLDGCMTSTTTGLKTKLCDVSLAQSLTTEVNGENVMATMYIPVATLKKKFKILATHFAAEKDRKFPFDAKKLVKDIIEDERFGVLLRIYIGDDGNFECILYIGQHKIGRGCGRKQRHALNAACKALEERLADPELHVENDGDTDKSSVARREGVAELYKLSEHSSGLSTCEQRSKELIQGLEVPLKSASNLPSVNISSGSIGPAPISHQVQADLSVLAGQYLVEKRANPCCKAKTLMKKVIKKCPLIKVNKITTKHREDGVYESTIEVGGVTVGYGSASRHNSAVDAAHDRFIEELMLYAKNGGSHDNVSDTAVCVTSDVGAENLCKEDSKRSSIYSSQTNAPPVQASTQKNVDYASTKPPQSLDVLNEKLERLAQSYRVEKETNSSHLAQTIIKKIGKTDPEIKVTQSLERGEKGKRECKLYIDGEQVGSGSSFEKHRAADMAYDELADRLLNLRCSSSHKKDLCVLDIKGSNDKYVSKVKWIKGKTEFLSSPMITDEAISSDSSIASSGNARDDVELNSCDMPSNVKSKSSKGMGQGRQLEYKILKKPSEYVFFSQEGEQITIGVPRDNIVPEKYSCSDLQERMTGLAYLYSSIVGNSREQHLARRSLTITEKCLNHAARYLEIDVKVITEISSNEPGYVYSIVMVDDCIRGGSLRRRCSILPDRRVLLILSNKLLCDHVNVHHDELNDTFVLQAFNKSKEMNQINDQSGTVNGTKEKSYAAAAAESATASVEKLIKLEDETLEDLLRCFVIWRWDYETDPQTILRTSVKFSRMSSRSEIVPISEGNIICTDDIWGILNSKSKTGWSTKRRKQMLILKESRGPYTLLSPINHESEVP